MVFKIDMISYNKKQLIGSQFGKLIVIKELSSKDNRCMWLCWCVCGQELEVSTNALTTGNTRSCGCLQRAAVTVTGRSNKGHSRNKGSDNSNWKGGVRESQLVLYDTYAKQLSYADNVRRSNYNSAILEIKCAYCGKWFLPKSPGIRARIRALNGSDSGENKLYCSDGCKKACPVFHKHKYPKGFKPATSREVQPELRQLVFERDDYTCQKCGRNVNETQIHCHHIDPVSQNPIESADLDNCITLCKKCHKEVHKQSGCGYSELRCSK